ncbi:uncharacterized protein STEHIDRAFT_144780 [Stereum hirsutum FP-91666 SS1]|uniref:uncharacterized protein n=1 Tax=Stereum hirsutum (strain FP-91666) TaxID=721885 RepID=UPI000440AB4D|nr:uncharacterized protein STEHIDRAFT_144780 [Stereum hirsutum FP-91666 SS1]EIM91540.1 hypothetical protein STEHIDRAFT_144780 [Stereum hirsutum FP-91666 SS1]
MFAFIRLPTSRLSHLGLSLNILDVHSPPVLTVGDRDQHGNRERGRPAMIFPLGYTLSSELPSS